MIPELLHLIYENGNRAIAGDKIRKGCWECYHKIDNHIPDEPMVSTCEVTTLWNHHLIITNPYCVPNHCSKRI